MLFRPVVIGALLLVAVLPWQARSQTPGAPAWRTDWSAFVPALQQCVRENTTCALNATEFLNGTVTWEGRLIEMRNRANCPLVFVGGEAGEIERCAIVEMPTGGGIDTGAISYTVNSRLTVYPTAATQQEWEALRPGPVRFRATLSAVSFIGSAFSSRLVQIGLTGAIANPPAAAPSIAENGIRSLATGKPEISPGSWFLIEGSDLAEAAAEWTEADVESGALPEVLGGVRVTVNGKAAALLSVSPAKMYAISPADDSRGPVHVRVSRGEPPQEGSATVELARLTPGPLAMTAADGQYVAAVHEDISVAGAAAAVWSKVRRGARPALPGSTIVLLATGLGATSPETAANRLFEGVPGLASPEQLQVRIGGRDASVVFAGLAGSTPEILRGLVAGWPSLDRAVPGLFALAVQVPDLPPGNHPVTISMDGIGGGPAPALLLPVASASAPQLLASSETVSLEWRQGSASPAAQAVELTTDGASAAFESLARDSWVRLTPASGTTPQTLRISVVTQGLAAGVHTSSVLVASNDAANGFVEIPISLTVTAAAPAPIIRSVTPSSAYPGQPPLEIAIAGSGLSGVTEIRLQPADGITATVVRVTDTAVTARITVVEGAARGTRQLRVVGPGGESGSIPFSIVTPPVVEQRPELRGPSSLAITFVAGTASPPAVSVSITSTGSPVSLSATTTGNIAVAPAAATTPATLQVRAINAASLAAGVYQAELQLTSSGAANSPLLIPVTITVQAAPASRTVTLRQAVTARSLPASGCDVPDVVTQFSPSDSRVWLWFTVNNAAIGDTSYVEFVAPNGVVETTNRFSPFTQVYGCYTSSLLLAGTDAAAKSGTWTIRIYWNAQLIGTRTFTVSGLAVERFTFSKVQPPTGCDAPPGAFTFSLNDATAHFWMLVRGHQAGDVTRIEWVSPANIVRTHTTYSPLPSAGNYCAKSYLLIRGLLSTRDIGTWRVRVFVNDVPLLDTPFVIAPVNIRYFALTRSVPLNACEFPEQATVFRRSDGYVALWFQATDAVSGHVITADWIAPDGTVGFSNPPVTIGSSGNLCQSFSMLIGAGPGSRNPGAWRVVLKWNGTAIGSLRFTIQ